ncbi:oligosaccharide flippase family protein [Latilactobacillus sakei]|uniref:oligosaccharide flippase family protein n=1 Tax=Latilactobacillus sakei TaxID=1599 RepID=UPI00345E0287
MNIKQVLKNFSYTIFSNLLSLVVSTLVVLIVPKLIGIDDYGYWQVYLFYTTYVGLFHLGWFDGIYLRYGGAHYSDLNKSIFNSQIVLALIVETVFSIIIIIYSFFITDKNMSYIVVTTAITMVIMNMGQLFLYILQITNQIRKYALFTVIGRASYMFLIILILLLGVRSFRILILADLISRVCSLVFGIYACRELVFRKLKITIVDLKEAETNILVGIKLLIANFSSNLVVGVIRLGIQRFWGVAVFGQISLTLNISNLLMTFIGAISLVLFPTLRRIKSNVEEVYSNLRIILITLLLCGLLLYFPIQFILPMWLPKYKDSLIYMAILFPMCLFDGKFEILINTFMKSLRLEKALLYLNISSVVFSGIITMLNILYLKNLTVMMFSIVLVLAVRSTIGELIIWKILKIREYRQLSLEVIIVGVFISSTWYLNLWLGLMIYLVVLISYIFSHISKLKKALIFFKNINY